MTLLPDQIGFSYPGGQLGVDLFRSTEPKSMHMVTRRDRFNPPKTWRIQAPGKHNVPIAVALSLLMWGTVYQGYNAVFPSFYPELFRTRFRVTAVAIAQNLGTTITALLPVLFTTVSPPGSTNIPWKIGSITFDLSLNVGIAFIMVRVFIRQLITDRPNPVQSPFQSARRMSKCLEAR